MGRALKLVYYDTILCEVAHLIKNWTSHNNGESTMSSTTFFQNISDENIQITWKDIFKRTIYVDNYNGKKLKIKSWVNSLVYLGKNWRKGLILMMLPSNSDEWSFFGKGKNGLKKTINRMKKELGYK